MEKSNVNRYCELVFMIKDLSKYLDGKYRGFYEGGCSFEKAYQYDLSCLNEYEKELKTLLKQIVVGD